MKRCATLAVAALLGCSEGFTAAAGAGGAGGSSSAGGGTADAPTSYGYRQPISIETGDALEAGYSIRLKLDHAELVGDAKAREDGDDVRIFAESDGSWSELPRVVEEAGWLRKDTLLWFALPEAIAAASTDDHYWLFYGDAGAASPPDDPAQVFAFWDGFDEERAGWTETPFGSTPNAHGVDRGLLTLSTRSGHIDGTKDSFLFFHRAFTGDFAAETKVVGKSDDGLAGAARVGGVMVRSSLGEGARNHTISPLHDAEQRLASWRLHDGEETTTASNDQGSEPLPAMVQIVRIGSTTQSFWSANAGTTWAPLGAVQTHETLLGETLEVGVPLATGSITVGDIPNPGYVEVDWFRIRLEVENAPTPTLGPEEPL